jgi:hypothetical protein
VTHSWSPSRGLVVVGWSAAAVAVVLTVLADHPPSRLLGVVATVGLAAAALFGMLARPRLTVDDTGVTVHGLTGARHWPWARVHRLRVVAHRRLGREVSMLELDALDEDGTEHLVVLGRIDLDADPHDVLAVIHSVRGLRP